MAPWQAYQETYFAGWGAGLGSSVLAEFWHTWNSSGVYDGLCRNRIPVFIFVFLGTTAC
jgi:hypothetical protein